MPRAGYVGSTTQPSQTTASSTTTSRCRVDTGPASEMPAMQTRTIVAATTAPTAITV